MTYIEPDLIGDEGVVTEAALAALADLMPGWEPSEGHVLTHQAEAIGIVIATAINVLKSEAANAYEGFGRNIAQIDRKAAGVAGTTSTWTIDTTSGLFIPGGTEVYPKVPDGTEVTFVVAEDTTIPPGVLSLPGVALVALEPGPEGNDAAGIARQDELVGVIDVVLDSPATGGSDEEDQAAYLDKLADRARRRMNFLPVTPAAHADMALDIPEVARALPVNRLDPAAPGVNSRGHLTIFPVTEAGGILPATARQTLEASYATLEKVLNAIVHVANPAFLEVTIAVTVRGRAGVPPADVSAQVSSAVNAAVDPATWDVDENSAGRWAELPARELTVFQVAAAIDDLDTIRSVIDITINGADEVALPAPLTIPRLATGSPTVTVV